MDIDHTAEIAGAAHALATSARCPARTVMMDDIPNKHILDTSAYNHLLDDTDRDLIIRRSLRVTVVPTALAIAEIAATENHDRRLALLRLIKDVGRDIRPLATPNQLIIAACQGFARRDRALTLNASDDAGGAWIALNEPELIDSTAQKVALEFNRDREDVLRQFCQNLRSALEPQFKNGVERPRSMGALIRGYAKDDDLLYDAVNRIYERAVGNPLDRGELRSLLNSLPYWPMFLAGYACAIYQRSVKQHGFGHANNPGHLDLWSATYLPACSVFVTADKRQRRALKILNKSNTCPALVESYQQWREAILS